MASFDSVNYSLRPNKYIERGIAFEGVRSLQAVIELKGLVYVGFGSVWFTDFQMAHKSLGIRDMWSIEANKVGYARALFNKPYKTVDVMNMLSTKALAKLFTNNRLANRPWLVWLDYDYALDESVVEDIRAIIERAPTNTILLVTVDSKATGYGSADQRQERLDRLLGDVVPVDLDDEQLTDLLPETIANVTLDFMRSVATNIARPGGFMPAFKMVYRDSATMVTVGGVLPGMGARSAVAQLVSSQDWPALIQGRIQAPHLTLRETASLQALLPDTRKLTRAMVKQLGFDLQPEQIASFQKYYKYYPSFAQISV